MRANWRAERWLGLAVVVSCLIIAPAGAGCGRKIPRRPMSGDWIELQIKGQELVVKLLVEVASDKLSREQGLMYRKELPESHGMIFVYRTPERLSFWMRNTYVPLSIAFLDDEGRILQIEDMRPKDESRTVSKTRVRYALEVNQGWFERNGVRVGDAISDFSATVGPYRGD